MRRLLASRFGCRPVGRRRLAVVRLARFGVLALLLAPRPGVCAAAAPAYAITDLGEMNVHAINNHGQVVGSASVPAGAGVHAALYDGIRLHDLGTLGGDLSFAYGINDRGQVVGSSATSGLNYNTRHAFLYSDGAMHDLGTLGGGASAAYAINAAGQVAGVAQLPGTPPDADMYLGHAFLSDHAGMHDLGTLGGEWSVAYGISADGEIVGSTVYGERTTSGKMMGISWEAFVSDGDPVRGIGTPRWQSFGYAINDRGQVVGTSWTRGHDGWDDGFVVGQQAFLYDGGGMRILGTLGGQNSDALGINALGEVVGRSEIGAQPGPDGTLPQHAFLYRYRGGEMIDLNDRLPPGSGWVLTEARAINDAGQIVGQGTWNGQPRSFLLTPGTDARPLPPQAPTDLSVKMASTSELDLTWTDNSDNEHGFELQVKQGSSDWTGLGTVPANQAGFAHTGLASFTHYTYRVRAINDAGASGWSAEAGGDTGLQAIAQLDPSGRIDFGSLAVGSQSASQRVTLTNTGNGPLTIRDAAVTGDAAGDYQIVPDGGGSSVAPGQSRTLILRFTPLALGSRPAALTLQDNAAGGPQTIGLSGSGILPAAGHAGLVLPVGAELDVVSIDGTPLATASRVVVSAGEPVVLRLRLKFADGALADVTADPASRFAAIPGGGSFTTPGVWIPRRVDRGKSITLVGSWVLPHSGRRWRGVVTIAVRARRARR